MLPQDFSWSPSHGFYGLPHLENWAGCVPASCALHCIFLCPIDVGQYPSHGSCPVESSQQYRICLGTTWYLKFVEINFVTWTVVLTCTPGFHLLHLCIFGIQNLWLQDILHAPQSNVPDTGSQRTAYAGQQRSSTLQLCNYAQEQEVCLQRTLLRTWSNWRNLALPRHLLIQLRS